MQIDELLNRQSKPSEITYMPTSSSHERSACNIANKFMSMYPEFVNTVYALSLLPALIWAEKENPKVEKSLEAIPSSNDADIYKKSKILYLLQGRKNAIDLVKTHEVTQEIIELLKVNIKAVKGQEGKCLKAIHLNGTDVSLFILNNYYLQGLLAISERVNEEITAKFRELLALYEGCEEEDLLAMHDINILFSLYKSAEKKNAEFCESIGSALMIIAGSLATYPSNAKEIKQIVSLYLKGKTEYEIGQKINKSRTYVRAKIQEGKSAMAILLWELSAKPSIEWMRKELQ